MDNFLSQEEIDALLNQGQSDDSAIEASDGAAEKSKNMITQESSDFLAALTDMELDALGEIGNISMGSASTALSELLNQKVKITTPKVKITSAQTLYEAFRIPYLLIDVNFTDGLNGSNILVIKIKDAAIIADLMMGGSGTNPSEELSEIHVSAVAEAMNQMIGSAATSMSTIFGESVKIAPPIVNIVDFQQDEVYYPWDSDEPVAVISFDLQIGDLIDSEIMQVVPVDIAKMEANLLLNPGQPVPQPTAPKPLPENKFKESENTVELPVGRSEDHTLTLNQSEDYPKNLNLILDVPLKVSVVLGKTKRPINEVLNLIPGSIVELERLANEPVDVLVNGTLIAKGEVVVINENYGVRVTSIVSPEQRLQNLKKN
ncbi:flagellar motor switch phosphatase FliY [Desulfitibacter alkalitolerans]|uniref:flagellar motor switch phosphatase FliY n=1 Tax=Desulfitibacter alkalitolerans TaxID=264641 RepID=UPI00047F1682|nr:flagellar motor switch phosphatase FliY [Desulfitibacter alkalitolerans]